MIPALEPIAERLTALARPATEPGVPVPGPAGGDASVSDPASAPPPGSPATFVDPKLRGYHLEVKLAPGQIVAAAAFLDSQQFVLDTITGVDWIAENQMEVVYDFFHFTAPWRIVLRTRLPRAQPELPSLHAIFPGANWHERETHEFFGIRFLGHPNLTPLLLPEDATYHPLRKDFVA